MAQERFSELCSVVGEEVLRRVEKQISLFHIDQCWAEYLEQISHIREGIFLYSTGGMNPLDEFHKKVAKAFYELMSRIDNEIIKTFTSAKIDKDGIDFVREGLIGPTSTWTYLISDNPFGDFMKRLRRGLHCFEGLKRALTDNTVLEQ